MHRENGENERLAPCDRLDKVLKNGKRDGLFRSSEYVVSPAEDQVVGVRDVRLQVDHGAG